jgi:hypothetical protein
MGSSLFHLRCLKGTGAHKSGFHKVTSSQEIISSPGFSNASTYRGLTPIVLNNNPVQGEIVFRKPIQNGLRCDLDKNSPGRDEALMAITAWTIPTSNVVKRMPFADMFRKFLNGYDCKALQQGMDQFER